VIGVPVCLLLIAYTAFGLVANLAEGKYHVSYTAPASTRSMTVTTAGGQLTLEPGAGGRATLAGTATYTFIRSTLTEQTAGGHTAVAYHCSHLPVGDCELDATLHVPAALPVSASTGGGTGSVTGLTGPVTLSSGGGNLSAARVSGPLSLNTSGGDVQLADVTSPQLTAVSGGGNIDAAGLGSATATLTTSGGDIRAAGVSSATVSAGTGGGDINITFTSVPRDVRVDTSGGNITLVLPPGSTAYHVTAQTQGGNVTDDLPQNSSSPDEITATSGGGDISIRQQ
jgi:hypothetical protein